MGCECESSAEHVVGGCSGLWLRWGVRAGMEAVTKEEVLGSLEEGT